MRKRPPEIALAPYEQLVRLTWPAGPRRVRPRVGYFVKNVSPHSSRPRYVRVVQRGGVAMRGMRRRTFWLNDVLGPFEERVWQRPLAVSEGL